MCGGRIKIYFKTYDQTVKLSNRGWSMSRGSLTRDSFNWKAMLNVGSENLYVACA